MKSLTAEVSRLAFPEDRTAWYQCEGQYMQQDGTTTDIQLACGEGNQFGRGFSPGIGESIFVRDDAGRGDGGGEGRGSGDIYGTGRGHPQIKEPEDLL